jgi:hypothetical protein
MSVKSVVIEPQYGMGAILALLPMYYDVSNLICQYYYRPKPEINIMGINDIVKGYNGVNIENFRTCMKNLAIHGVTKMKLQHIKDYDDIMNYLASRDIICDTRVIHNKFNSNEFKSNVSNGFVVISIIGAIMLPIFNMDKIAILDEAYVTKDFRQNTAVLYTVQSHQDSSIPEAYANMIDGAYIERDNVSGILCMSYEKDTYIKNHDGYTINADCKNGELHGMFSKKLSPVNGSMGGAIHSIKANYVDGILDGKYVENINGYITTINYANGKKHGTYSKKSPTISVDASYVDNVLNGKFVKKLDECVFTANYSNGILNGPYSKKSPTHTIESNYVNGKLHGAYMETRGTRTTEISYSNGKIMMKKIKKNNTLYIIHKFNDQRTKHVIKLYVKKLAVKVTVYNGLISEYDIVNDDVVNSIIRRSTSESMRLEITGVYINEHWENVLNDLYFFC